MASELTEATVVARTTQAASRELEGQVFIVRAGSADLIALNDTGSALWRYLEGPTTVGQLAGRLATEFEIGREVALADCLVFLGSLQARELLQVE